MIRWSKPHRRLPGEDSLWRRLGDVGYVLAVFLYEFIWQPRGRRF